MRRAVAASALVLAGLGLAAEPCPKGREDAFGVVFDADGKPIERAKVKVAPLDDFDSFTGPRSESDEDFSAHRDDSDASGRWRVRCLPRGRYSIQVNAGARPVVVDHGTTGALLRTSVVPGARAIVRVRVPDGGLRLGVDAFVGPAVETPDTTEPRPRAPRLSRLDAGVFMTAELSDGRYVASAYLRDGRSSETHAFDVRDGRAPTLELAFTLATLSGTVRTPDGRPAAGAWVHATSERAIEEIRVGGCGNVAGYRGFSAYTDARGQFELPGLERADSYAVEAELDALRSEEVRKVVPGAAPLELKLEKDSVTADGSIVVTVEGATSATVELDRGAGRVDSMTTERSRAVFENRPTGPAEVRVFAPGMASHSLPVRLESDVPVKLGPIALAPERPLRVRVVDGDSGRSVPDARLWLDRPEWRRAQFESDSRMAQLGGLVSLSEQGTVELHGLPDEPVPLGVIAPGYAPAHGIATRGEKAVEIRLQPYGPINFKVHAPNGDVRTKLDPDLKSAFPKGTSWRRDGVGEAPALPLGRHVLSFRDRDANRSPRLFPAWFEQTPAGATVDVFEAAHGAVLRVHAYREYRERRWFFLAEGEVEVPVSPDPLQGIAEWGLRPAREGKSGAEFQPVRPGVYTAFVYEGVDALGGSHRFHVWRKVVSLKEGVTDLDLDAFERRPDQDRERALEPVMPQDLR